MELITYKIQTSSGTVNTYLGHPLAFLTLAEKAEFDCIGYSGTKINGKKATWDEYLNSLGKGVFSIEKTKWDNGDFQEAYIINRVVKTDEDIKNEKITLMKERYSVLSELYVPKSIHKTHVKISKMMDEILNELTTIQVVKK